MRGVDRGVMIGVVACTAAGGFGLASITFAFPAVADEFGLSLDARTLATRIPLISSLLVIFLAGTLNDRLGPRRVGVTGGLLFCAGAIIVATSPSLLPLIAGRALEGAGATCLLIVAVAVTRSAFRDERERSKVYGIQAATTPAIYVLGPLLGALLASELTWRTVPLVWIPFGVGATVAAWRFFPTNQGPPDSRPELLTPTLAGIAVAGVAGAASSLLSSTVAAGVLLGVGIAAGAALAILLSTEKRLSLDLSPLKLGGFRLALLAASLPVAASFFFFTSLLVEYHYDYGLIATAAVMAPASALSVVAGILAGRLMARRGPIFTGVLGLAVAGLAGLATFLVDTNSPAWVPALIVCIYAAADTVAIAALTANALNRVRGKLAGSGSSLRKAATGLGATAGALLAGLFVWTTYEREVATAVDRTTIVTERDAREFASRVRQDEGSALLAERLSASYGGVRPLIDRREEILEDAEIAGYQAAGLVLAIIYGVTTMVLIRSGRRYPLTPEDDERRAAPR